MAEPYRHPTSGVGRPPDPSAVSILVAGRSGGSILVRVVGRLDAHAAPRLSRELAAASRLLRRGPPRLTLDLSGISYLDDTCLEVLLELQDCLAAESGDLELQSPTEAVVRLLHEAHLYGSARRPANGPADQ